MSLLTVSEALRKFNVWHKVKNGFICTRKTRIRIPDVGTEIAYLAGVIAGDGCLTSSKRKKGGYHYRVNIVGHLDDLENLAGLVKELFNYKFNVRRDRRKRNCYLMNMDNVAIFAYFNNLGLSVGRKRNLCVPQIIANDPLLFKHYMLGLTDTDGYVDKKMLHLKQRDEGFLEELVILLEKHFGIESNPPKVNFTEGKPYYYIRFPNKLKSDF